MRKLKWVTDLMLCVWLNNTIECQKVLRLKVKFPLDVSDGKLETGSVSAPEASCSD